MKRMRQLDPFHAATLKLTGWYLAILMAVSLSFSIVIYNISAHELDRPLPPNSFNRSFEDNDAIRMAREARSLEGKQHLVTNLVILNVATLALGTAASYLYARRTLKPIEEAMEAQSRFVSDASHELRTPLAVMRTENEIALRDKKPQVNDLREVLTSNLEEVERLQLLTDRLLALSSRQELPLSRFDVSQSIAEAAARHEVAAKQKRIKITPHAAKLSALGDPDTVSDILSILIDNAIKYSPEKTTVTIDAVEAGKKVQLRVADQGPGISAEEKAKVFERFYRSDESRTKQHVEGHGLGLALAARLAVLNRAQLTILDNTPSGSVFILELDKA